MFWNKLFLFCFLSLFSQYCFPQESVDASVLEPRKKASKLVNKNIEQDFEDPSLGLNKNGHESFDSLELLSELQGHVMKVDSWGEIDFDALNSSCIVVTDIDKTLIQSSDSLPWNYESGAVDEATRVIEDAVNQYPNLTSEFISQHIFTDQNSDLIEHCVKYMFKKLRARGVGVIACTACISDGWFLDLRVKRMAELEMCFGLPQFYVTRRAEQALSLWQDHPWFKKPIYSNGILFTDHLTIKGELIMAFLKATCPLSKFPKKIVLVDDLLGNHASVYRQCLKAGIDFQGFLYSRVRKIPWNEKMVLFQLKTLSTKGIWLRDCIAKYSCTRSDSDDDGYNTDGAVVSW